MALPTLEDFPGAIMVGMIFISYVNISLITGRFTTNVLRKVPTKAHDSDIENALHRWIQTLPEPVRLVPRKVRGSLDSFLNSYNFDCRQVHVLYLVNLILLYRSPTVDGPFPAAAVIASSTVAGIFEEFLARDEVRLLGPMFTFHLLAAAIALLSCHKYTELREIAEKDLKVIRQAQEEMKKKWPSAIGSIRSFERMHKLAVMKGTNGKHLSAMRLTPSQTLLFQDIDIDLCRLWEPLQKAGIVTDLYDPSWVTYSNEVSQVAPIGVSCTDDLSGQPGITHHLPVGPLEQLEFDELIHNDPTQFDGGIGDWLFSDQSQLQLNFA